MTIYYQFQTDEHGVIIGIQSSDVPFLNNQITLKQIEKIVFGKTKASEIINN